MSAKSFFQAAKQGIARANPKHYAFIVLGALIFAVGQRIFIMPALIPMGGISGLSLVLNYLYDLPVGIVSIVANIPLFFLGYRTLGKTFFAKTVFGTVVASVFLDLLAPFLPAYDGEVLIAAIYGGIVMGAGFGIIFRVGGTSGGTDIIAKYLNKKRDMPIGTFNLIVNTVVILISAAIYQNIDSAFYAIITSYLTSTVIDKIIYGADIQKNAMIITTKPKEISDAIFERLGRGVTALSATGMFTGESKTVLISAVRRHETSTLKALLQEVDSGSFLLLSNLNEVFGSGFKNYGQ